MAAQKGRAFVLKISDGLSSPAFSVVGGMRTTGLTINGEMVDVTDKDSDGWRELLANAGTRTVTISFAGVFKDTATEEQIKDAAFNQDLNDYRAEFEDGDFFSGAFQLTSLEYTGEHNGARQYSGTLESSGTVTNTP